MEKDFMPKPDDNPISDENTESQESPVSDCVDYSKLKVDYTTSKGERLLFESGDDFIKFLEAKSTEDNEPDKTEDDDEPHNYWNYRVVEEKKHGKSSFSIIEVYYMDGKIVDYIDSDRNVLGGWQDYDNLKGTWEFVKGAFDKPVLKIDENGNLYENGKKVLEGC